MVFTERCSPSIILLAEIIAPTRRDSEIIVNFYGMFGTFFSKDKHSKFVTEVFPPSRLQNSAHFRARKKLNEKMELTKQ